MPARSLPAEFHVAFSFAGEQRALVRSIAESVEKVLGHGTTFFDEWFEAHIAGDDADLKLQEIYGERCVLAVVCVSANYGGKPWTLAEHAAIRARMMKARASPDERVRQCVLPIRVGEGEVAGILFNAIVPDCRARPAEEAASLIVERLRIIRPDLDPTPGTAPGTPQWPGQPPALSWPMADHVGAREAFGQLMTAGSGCRLLSIRGSSETGKSHITRQMLANALAIPDVACGKFDFKGTTGMDRELAAFIQELGISAPAATLRLHDQFGQILASLRQKAKPALLIFDTYEMAGELQDWVEKQLLTALVRAGWLRVVIAGQKVPDRTGAVWAAVAGDTLHLTPPPPPDWLDYGKRHRPNLTLAEVETACRLAADKAGLLAQLLGPAT